MDVSAAHYRSLDDGSLLMNLKVDRLGLENVSIYEKIDSQRSKLRGSTTYREEPVWRVF